MIAAARRLPAWKVLSSIPFFGPVGVAQVMANPPDAAENNELDANIP